jgi:hypothetical protein
MMTLDYIAANSPCVDCNALSGCASSELTAQCTDQCVVIACNDPDHGEAPCVGGEQHAQCDPTCGEKTFDCTGCYGFDTDSFVSFSLGNAGLNLTLLALVAML